MKHHSDPSHGEPNPSDFNPSDPGPDDLKPSQGRHGPPPDGSQPMESGVLPEDFGRRLERLKEASGLSWRGLGRALGVDPKRLGLWRKGVEPCGGAMHSIHRFAYRMPGGTAIIMGEDFPTGFFQEEEDDGVGEVDVDVSAEDQDQEEEEC